MNETHLILFQIGWIWGSNLEHLPEIMLAPFVVPKPIRLQSYCRATKSNGLWNECAILKKDKNNDNITCIALWKYTDSSLFLLNFKAFSIKVSLELLFVLVDSPLSMSADTVSLKIDMYILVNSFLYWSVFWQQRDYNWLSITSMFVKNHGLSIGVHLWPNKMWPIVDWHMIFFRTKNEHPQEWSLLDPWIDPS